MTKNTFKLILFDLDGTLADTLPDLATAIKYVLLEQDLPVPDPAILREKINHGGLAMLNAALTSPLPPARMEKLMERFLQLYRENIAEQTQLFPGMVQVLEHLESNQIQWGIVTNKRSGLTEPLVDALGLRQRAACVVSGDSAPRAKPHPDPLLLALKQTTCRAGESLYVGDAQNDVRAAHAAGISAVVAGYGYISSQEDYTAWQADAYIDSPLALLEWLGIN